MGRLLFVAFICAVLIQGGLVGRVNAEVRVGQLDILADVHGYDAGGRVLVPLRGIAEWLGAQVQFDSPTIRIELDDRRIELRVNGTTASVNGRAIELDAPAKVYGGTTCVPVRFIGEALGLSVQYKSPDRPVEADVLLQGAGHRGRVLIHREPPNVVAEVVADLENTTQRDLAYPEYPIELGGYGTDWIAEVNKVHSGYFRSSAPMCWEDLGGGPEFFANAWGVYGKRDGRWRLLTGGNDMPSRKAWTKAGIPISVAHELGMQLSPHDY